MNEYSSTEFRELTPTEIGSTVRTFRELAGIKQVTLAHRAEVTERTIQRIENGEKASEVTLKQVAQALGLAEGAFIGPRAIRQEEEACRDILSWFDRYEVVRAEIIEDWQPIERLLHCQAVTIVDGHIGPNAAKTSAEIRDYFTHCLDCADLASATELVRWAEEILQLINVLNKQGVVAKYSLSNMQGGLKQGALILVPRDHELATAKHSIMAKNLGTNMTEADVRLARQITHLLNLEDNSS